LFSSTMFLCSASLFFFLYFFISSLGLFFMGSHIWFIFGGKTTMLQDTEVWCWSWEFAQARSRAWKGLKICIIIWFYKISLRVMTIVTKLYKFLPITICWIYFWCCFNLL
jgi:hypothetical protein